MLRFNRFKVPVTVFNLLTWMTMYFVGADAQSTRRSERVHMETISVASPDGMLQFTILPNAERLTFTLTRNGVQVLDPSTIVMQLDEFDLSAGLALEGVERYTLDESYPWYGAHSTAVNRCNGARISLNHDLSFTDYQLEVRVFDDGAAFRHVISGGANSERIPDEYTTFVLPEGSQVWYHGLGGHYEDVYKEAWAGDVPPGQWSGPPLTYRLPDGRGYAVLAEANLVNYSGMALEADGRRGWVTGLAHRQPLNYPFELRYGREEAKRLAHPAAITGSITTPWRVIMSGATLDVLVNSTIMANLCPPPDPKLFPDGLHTPWIQPGRAVWRYLDGGDRSLEGLKAFSRMAGELGFESQVVEGFWRDWSDAEIKEFVDYSREQGVGLWFWRHSKELRTHDAQEEFFSRLEQLGVVGAKVDFFDHEAKDIIDVYESLLRTSAKYGILVNFHGANKPTGRARTWPNELAREAVRGMESSSLQDRARHETILPFARFLAGHADYTVLHFGDRRGDTSAAHQIASMAILSCPLLTLAANPATVLEHPAVEMIRSIPSVWDETRVLPPSEVGKLAVFARRSGETWFLAVMCGPEDVQVSIPLSFLGPGKYDAQIVADRTADPSSVQVDTGGLTASDAVKLTLKAGGGYIARYTR